jgi:hypothetical protein
MSNKVLFVFEGNKTEPSIFNTLSKIHSFNIDDNFIFTFENCLYDLWKIIDDDPYLDVVEVIRERNKKNSEAMKGCNRSEISQVYLFFDLDSHDPKYTEKKVRELLDLFSNETENGAIFVSYPMVEALRHFNSAEDFYEKKVCSKKNINYKRIVHEESDKKYQQFHKLKISELNDLIRHHIIKSNYICGLHNSPLKISDFSKLHIKYMDQGTIFSNQVSKFINYESKVSVLSSFPLFFHQYFGDGIFNKLNQEQ